ncbi:MAG: 2-C-methyl-D-erythritol 4-phosphate cytidylyltransferase [Hymenobacteraceae bacterium]|nr:2-C-methyl-D-erythritol 4-phosphate cytidylyltransferase [Hymenobacteraceae bacterium]
MTKKMGLPHGFAVIVAGGSGHRMGTTVPKQFLLLAGEPVLLRTLRRFANAVPTAARVVVLPAAECARWQALLADFPDAPTHQVIAGGATRLASVRAGLAALNREADSAIVAIHDGVRPLVPIAVIQAAYHVAAGQGSAVAAVALKDSLRRVLPDGSSVHEDRAAFRLVQTPQCFPLGVLRAAYAAVADTDAALTDDASVVARHGHAIGLIEGSYENLKITTPDDLLLAEILFRRQSAIS